MSISSINDVAQVLKNRPKNALPVRIPEKSMMEKFLCKIASKTENMIRYDAKKVYYLKAIVDYRGMREKFLQALQQSQKEAVENQSFYDENAAEPPMGKEKWEQGWELEEYYLIKGKVVEKKFWRQPLPFDPDYWIMHHYGSSFYNRILAHRKFPKEPNPKEPNNAENIICKLIVLAVIHDNVRATLQCQKLFSSCDNEWVRELWGSILGCTSASDDNSYDDRKQRINEALNNVKTYLRLKKADLAASTPKDREKVKTQTRVKNNWKSPKGYIGSQAIILSTVGELKEKLKLPHQGDEEYKIPRSTLGGWQSKDSKAGGELEGNIKRDPSTYEVYYPNKWFKKQIMKYIPKVRKP